MSEKRLEVTPGRTSPVTSWVNLCFLVAHSELCAIDLVQGVSKHDVSSVNPGSSQNLQDCWPTAIQPSQQRLSPTSIHGTAKSHQDRDRARCALKGEQHQHLPTGKHLFLQGTGIPDPVLSAAHSTSRLLDSSSSMELLGSFILAL